MKKKNTLILKKRTKKALIKLKNPLDWGFFLYKKINTNSKQSITLAKETSEQKFSPPLLKPEAPHPYSSA